ncbi:MAG: winged helix-turn-helix transcriptional regulator [Desulfurococcaceae archaeon]|jgi:predicted transcriptional regulator|nr:winged helix-turn-helix transcriptional regulator [Desulfurococcaceae archaeon]
MGRAGERYLKILRELLKTSQARPVTLAEVGRRLGLSRQLVHKYVKELARMGYVAKVGRYYVLTDKGKGVLDLASEEVAQLREAFRALVVDVAKVEPSVMSQLSGGLFCLSLDAPLALLAVSLYYSLLEASGVVDPKMRDEVLDKLWREELKERAKHNLLLVELCGLEGVVALIRMIQNNLFIYQYSTSLFGSTSRMFEATLKALKLLKEAYRDLQKNASSTQ